MRVYSLSPLGSIVLVGLEYSPCLCKQFSAVQGDYVFKECSSEIRQEMLENIPIANWTLALVST